MRCRDVRLGSVAIGCAVDLVGARCLVSEHNGRPMLEQTKSLQLFLSLVSREMLPWPAGRFYVQGHSVRGRLPDVDRVSDPTRIHIADIDRDLLPS